MEAKIANPFWPGADRFYHLLDIAPFFVHRGMAPVLLILYNRKLMKVRPRSVQARSSRV